MPAGHVETLLAEHEIRFVLAQFVDIHGAPKTKVVPVEHLAQIVDQGVGFAGEALSGFGRGPRATDLMARGDPDTLTQLPWLPGYARIVCEAQLDGRPCSYDSRRVLQDQIARLAGRSWTLYTGIEPEFFLFKRDADQRLARLDSTDSLSQPCYDYKALRHPRGFLEQMTSSLQATGFDIYQIDHEDANGQFEINYAHADALTSADRLVLFRMAASEIAAQHGMVCSFMPKPCRTLTGSGMHFHLSIADRHGKNLFHDAQDPQGLELSTTAYHFLAGLLRHAPALCALAAPTVNSYKRLVTDGTSSGATWAPVDITYGDNNRSAMIRIPHGRLELRLPDSACNPYLVTAAIIAAGLDGIDNQLEAGPPRAGNHHDPEASDSAAGGRAARTLPRTLGEALEAIDEDPLFRTQLGTPIIDEFIRVKRQEWIEYCNQVTPWEIERYAELF